MAEALGARQTEGPPWKGAAFVLGAALSWGLVSTLVKLLFNRDEVTPASLTAVRISIAFLLLLTILGPRRRGRLLVRRDDLPLLCVMGSVGLAANGYCFYKTLSVTNVATAVLLADLSPIFLALSEGVILGRWPPRPTRAAIGLAVGGCFILVKGYEPAALRLNLPGLAFGLATAVAFAVFSVTAQRAMRRYDAWTVLLYGYGVATLTWWVAVPPWTLITAGYRPALWATFVALAVGGTLLPFSLFIRGLAYLSPTHATILNTMEPVIAAGVAYLVLGETMAPGQYAGALLVLAAVVLVQLWPAALPRRGDG